MIDGPTLAGRRARAPASSVEEVFTSRRAIDAVVDAAAARRRDRARGRARRAGPGDRHRHPAGRRGGRGARRGRARRWPCGGAAQGPLALVLVDVADPGNAGTLVRAAEAAGAAAVLFCGSSVDPSNAKCVRASAGALFHVPIAAGGDVGPVLERLGDLGVRRAATVVARRHALRRRRPHRSGRARARQRGPRPRPTGARPPSTSASRSRWTVASESLNVAMAGSVLCFESLRQRRAAR